MTSMQRQTGCCAVLLLGLVACDRAAAPPLADDPAEGPTAASIADGAAVMAYTTAPELANRQEVVVALTRSYPPLLRDAGIGGTALVGLFIDRTGAVAKVELRETSGYGALDEAAAAVAETMRFEPALDGDRPVDVWVALPIRFSTSVTDAVRAETGTSQAKSESSPAREAQPSQRASVADGPQFTPFTREPDLANRAEVVAALARNYPPLLRDAGIGGKAMVWLFIDETGTVRETRVAESSGFEALDAAAQEVAGSMRFDPARFEERPVPVWVQLPIAFRASGT